MSDLFEDSTNESEAVSAEAEFTCQPGRDCTIASPTQNEDEKVDEEPLLENGTSACQNGVDNKIAEDFLGLSEETEEEGEASPCDDFKLTVVQYQKIADDFAFEVLVEHNGTRKTVFRNYKDLLWLHRYLTRTVNLGGNILPPMPPPPPKSLDPTVTILGEVTKALYGDHDRLPCLLVEIFLQALADHQYFSEDNMVYTYLMVAEQVTSKDKLGAGSLWSSFTKVIWDWQLNGIEDAEEELVKFLKNIEDQSPKLLDASKAFLQLVSTQQNMALSEFVIIETMKDQANWSRDKNQAYCSVMEKMMKGLEVEMDQLTASSLDGLHTLGFTLELYHAYSAQAKEMLYRRLSKLQTLLSCLAQLDKAKPERKAAAETAKEEADREFKLITETAKREVKLYKEKYMNTMKVNLIGYTEAKITHAKRTHHSLKQICSELSRIYQ